jgi:hypothetical protein
MEVNPQAGLAAEPVMMGRMLDRPAPRAVPPVGTEAGKARVTATVLLTVRLAPVE